MARMYDYALGGKDNFASDREAVQNLFRLAPENAYVPKANRQFLGKAVRFAAEQGIGQFLDLCQRGLPSQGSTHEIARLVQPGARVVYVDSDPVVLTHARALLVGNDSGLAVIDEDIRDTGRILEHTQTRRLIDFSQPAAVLFVAVLHGIPDADDPAGIVAKYLERPGAPGSYVILSHLTREGHPADIVAKKEEVFAKSPTPMTYRSRDEILQPLRRARLGRARPDDRDAVGGRSPGRTVRRPRHLALDRGWPARTRESPRRQRGAARRCPVDRSPAPRACAGTTKQWHKYGEIRHRRMRNNYRQPLARGVVRDQLTFRSRPGRIVSGCGRPGGAAPAPPAFTGERVRRHHGKPGVLHPGAFPGGRPPGSRTGVAG